MRLQRLELCNFRQYYGTQTLQISRDPSRNVTVVNGVNGAGKTSLFMALNWCLYGDSVLEDKPGQLTKNVGHLINKRAITEAKDGARVEMSVNLAFLHDGTSYLAHRSRVYVKHGVAQWSDEGRDSFKLYRIRSTNAMDELSNASGRIEEMLSPAVRSYFFFDGERIEKFTAPGHESDVESAIRGVLRIEILKRAEGHLDSVAKDLQRLLRADAGGKLQALQDEEANTRAEKEKTEQQLVNVVLEIKKAQQHIAEYDNRLLAVSRVQGDVQERKAKEAKHEEKTQERDQIDSEIRQLASRGYIALSKTFCNDSRAAIEVRRQRGDIPSGIREQFLRDLLSEMRCICDRPLKPDTPEYKHVLDLLDRAVPAKLEDLLLQSSVDLASVVRRAQEIPIHLAQKLTQRSVVSVELESLYDEIDELTRKIGKTPEENVGLLETKRREAQERQQKLFVQQGSLQEKVTGHEIELRRLNREILQQSVQNAEMERLRSKQMLARDASDAIGEIFEAFAAEMRAAIQESALSIFRRLLWKQSQFQQIAISDDYRLEVLDRWGLPARPELSAGERQVLSLAFITGMAKVSGEEAPLVMDTPFGRLSSAHRENITAALPDLSTQIVLLVQDQELTGNARRVLEPRIGAEYELVFDEVTGCTSVQLAT